MSPTMAEPTAINEVYAADHPVLINAFHPVWQAAANRTARKTKVPTRQPKHDPKRTIPGLPLTLTGFWVKIGAASEPESDESSRSLAIASAVAHP